MKRTLTLAAAVLVAVGSIAGIVAFGGVGSAAATADGTTYASITSIDGESLNGQVNDVTLDSTGYVEWANLQGGAETVTVTLEARDFDGDWHEFANDTHDVDGNASDDYSYDRVGGSLFNDTNYGNEDFNASDDGETRSQFVPVKVTVTAANGDGQTCEFSETHKVKTEVTNLADPTINGNTSVDGEIDMDRTGDDCTTCENSTA